MREHLVQPWLVAHREDWYAVDRDTGDAVIYAIAAGEVVYVGFDYPGRVVIIQHAVDLYSVYGHLNFDTPVRQGQQVSASEVIGSVLLQTAGRAPSHLHFEARTFLTTARVNGGSPSYGVNCGVNCPPGPGYWPINAPEHPVELGGGIPPISRRGSHWTPASLRGRWRASSQRRTGEKLTSTPILMPSPRSFADYHLHRAKRSPCSICPGVIPPQPVPVPKPTMSG